ncbi:MAG TPA: hypothetical protein VKR23_16150 [Gaiellaceae bacterium]|nr:hypothetical protein [Gaiellaceae bacterium]
MSRLPWREAVIVVGICLVAYGAASYATESEGVYGPIARAQITIGAGLSVVGVLLLRCRKPG